MYASANGVDDRDVVCMHKSACAEVPIDFPGCVRKVCGIRSIVIRSTYIGSCMVEALGTSGFTL